MKILRVSGIGIRSLSTAFDVDLTTGHLAHGGLFAIVGPTGAGKSTLLDAICLALYGRVPRVPGKVGGVRLPDGEESISETDPRTCLSHGVGEGWAEVEFAVGEGRYRSTWRVHRARKKPRGKLQPDSMEITDLVAGQTLANKKKDVEARVVALTGLDFDQFQRSVLLAQGQFARFLQADERARAALLETMTGQTIYAQLSVAAYQRSQEWVRTRHGLVARSEALELPTEEDYQETVSALGEASGQRKESAHRLEALAAALRWYETQEALATRLHKAQSDVAEAEADWLAFAPELTELNRAVEAREVRAEREALVSATRRLSESRERGAKAQAIRTAALADLAAATESAQAAEEHREAVQHQRADLAEPLARARALDGDVSRVSADLDDLRDKVGRQIDVVAKARAASQSLQGRLEQAQIDEQTKRAWLEANSAACALSEQGAIVRERLVALAALNDKRLKCRQDIEQARSEDEARKSEADSLAAELAEREATLAGDLGLPVAPLPTAAEFSAALAEAQAAAQAAERDASKALRAAEAAEPARALRPKLVAGTPCPVCGSLDHPHANEPFDSDEMSRLNDHLEQATRRVSAVASLAREREAMAAQRLGVDRARLLRRESVARLNQVTESCAALDQEVESLQLALEPLLGPWRSTWEAETPETLRTEIDRLVARVAAARTDIERARNDQAVLSPQSATAAAELKASIQVLDGLAAAEAEAVTRLEALVAARKAILDGRTVAAVEEALLTQEAQASKRLEAARKEAAAAQATAVGSATGLEAAERGEAEAADEVGRAQAAWVAVLADKGLPADDVEALLARGDEWFEGLKERRDQLQDAVKRARTTAEVRQEEWARHQSDEKRPGETREAIEAELKAEQAHHDDRDLAVQTLFARRQSMDQARAQAKTLVDSLERHDRDAAPWIALSDLIGSADGARFRKFAQGLALLQLLALANQQMAHLNPRYRIERVGGTDLDIAVVDRHQADQVRPVSSLSGGETFLVSLALALGLAQFTGGGSPLQSLFIDEGFGSLDQATLDDALDALDRLQSEGRTIGIISHVEALRERIASKIIVTPAGAGRSELKVEL